MINEPHILMVVRAKLPLIIATNVFNVFLVISIVYFMIISRVYLNTSEM